MELLPQHLSKFVVNQAENTYTPRDHAVWRYILRQLKSFLALHAHPFYLEGLNQTGITVDSIPKISQISEKLTRHGWRACPVSGFIPPAAFMEMQSQSVLPIASDMRSIDQLMYTPAPDIVHEAAGHAPMLAHPEYAAYLREYAQVAKYAIASQEDLAVYEAIRYLSDVKANAQALKEEIEAAENKLSAAIKNVSHISEATLLSRMNWWTAEYGLIGSLDNPKIYGAGLLSSVGEAKFCLSEKVKKLPLTVDCIQYTYDITEPQPQLFVTPDFKSLSKVLAELSAKMAYKIGGLEGLEKAALSKTVNTAELSSGVQISGQVVEFIRDSSGQVAFFKTEGPSQICFDRKELKGHSKTYHSTGYSSPVGTLKAFPFKCPSTLTEADWKSIGVQFSKKSKVVLEYTSGVKVVGEIISSWEEKNKTILISLSNAKATFDNKILFDPSWGTYDIVLGSTVKSVFGGPADRLAFGEMADFVVAKIPPAEFSEQDYRKFAYYQIVRDVRDGKKTLFDLETALNGALSDIPQEWLFFLETLELTIQSKQSKLEEVCRSHLKKKIFPSAAEQCILDGLAIVNDQSL